MFNEFSAKIGHQQLKIISENMLSPSAQKMLKEYFNLPFPGAQNIRCPYFNNSRLARRGQLRVLAGKGTPKEIVEEAKIISLQYHAGLFDKTGQIATPDNPAKIKEFLVDHNLGIDCSGFVTQILQKHFAETKGIDLKRKLFKNPKNIFRRLVNFVRPIENIGVRTYFDDRNTEEIKKIADSQAGDLIIMMATGPNNKRNHVILVLENDGKKIKYAHARAWSSEGRYGHGVAEGEILINDPEKKLTEQEWVELEKTGEQNETLTEAKQAKNLMIKRIK